MFFDVADAQYVSEYRIRLKFEDGSRGTVDLSGYIKPDTVFEAFSDKEYFKGFHIEYGTLVWGEGEVDIPRKPSMNGLREKKSDILQRKTRCRRTRRAKILRYQS